jgi:hypothetical protein
MYQIYMTLIWFAEFACDSLQNFHKVTECLEDLATLLVSTKGIPFQEAQTLPFSIPGAVLQEAENQLRFVRLKPRVIKSSTQRSSTGTGKFVAIILIFWSHSKEYGTCSPEPRKY